MLPFSPWQRAASLVSVCLFASACSKPEAPTLEPVSATVTQVTAQGVDLSTTLSAKNPNGVAIKSRAVKAQMILDGRVDLGTVNLSKGIEIPSKGTTQVVLPMQMKWSDMAQLGLLVASGKDIPYEVRGSAEFGVSQATFSVPFTLRGTITKQQMANAAVRSLPSLPGLLGN